jgi:hypothetical protein
MPPTAETFSGAMVVEEVADISKVADFDFAAFISLNQTHIERLLWTNVTLHYNFLTTKLPPNGLHAKP